MSPLGLSRKVFAGLHGTCFPGWWKRGLSRARRSYRGDEMFTREVKVTFPAFDLDAVGLTSCIPIQQCAKRDVGQRI